VRTSAEARQPLPDHEGRREGDSGVTRLLSGDVATDLGDVTCALGVFDGVHEGHRKVIGDCVARAREIGAKSLVLTFDRDPEEVLFPERSARKILSNEDRIALLEDLGADYVLVRTFDKEFSRVAPRDFVETVLLSNMTPRAVFVGNDFHFGHRAAGNVRLLREMLADSGCEVVGEDLVCESGEPVSATRIRFLIENGGLGEANEMLGRMHYVRADVRLGRQVGRTLGYPTANLVPCHDYVTLCDGVYAGYVFAKGAWHRASISVGVPKTFGDIAWTIEAHLIDFDDDIYDERVVACFATYLRPMIKFSSPDELIDAIAHDTGVAEGLPMPPAGLASVL